MRPTLVIVVAWLALAGCGGDATGGPLDGGDAAGSRPDARDASDADGADARDAAPGREDAGDASSEDADASTVDAGSQDGAAPDAAPTDGEVPDAVATEDGAAAPDAPVLDASPADATSQADTLGPSEVWVEIDYSAASSPQSPAWSFSATPGWGPAQWAMAGDTWPEAWDRWNNLTVVDDPIGRALEIGPSGVLQLMLGLEELAGHAGVTVRLEGRSRDTSSHVEIDVYNPWNSCGIAQPVTMDQDWSIDTVELDLGQCLVPGQEVQAVRVEPVGGSSDIALVRMRVTLHAAAW